MNRLATRAEALTASPPDLLAIALRSAQLATPSPHLLETRAALTAARNRAAERARTAAEWLELCPNDSFAMQCAAAAIAEVEQANHALKQLCAPELNAGATAIQLHREALAASLRDPEALHGIGYRELILLALAARRDAAQLPSHLAVPALRLSLVRSVFAQLMVVALLLVVIAARLREYTPPTLLVIPAAPEQLTQTLALAPGAPSLAVCV